MPGPISPEFLRALATAQAAVEKATAWKRDIDRTLHTTLGPYAQQLVAFQQQAQPFLRTAVELANLYRESLPANWRELDGNQLAAAWNVAEEATLSIIWAPQHRVLIDVLQEKDTPSREAVLVRERDTILSDVERLLGDAAVTSPPKMDLVSMAIEALQVARASHERAAQALLAAALGRLIHDVLGYERLGQAYRALADDPDEATLTEARLVCLQLATANALTDVNRNPEGFNRHGTQHGDTAFFSTAAMLSGLILVAGWVQELTWFEDRGLSIPGWS